MLVGKGLYGYPSDGYWLDIGTPERYLQGTFDIIEGNVETSFSQRIGDGLPGDRRLRRALGRVIPPAVLGPGVRVERGAHVGSLVVLGSDVRVGSGTTIERAVVLNGSTSARAARCATASSRPAPRSGPTRRSPEAPSWARA